MKIINSKKNKFAGNIIVKDKEVFVNTIDGSGFYKVIELMKPNIDLLTKFGLSIFPWSSYKDVKQDICVIILDGISKYNPDKKTSITTFLYMFTKNRLIDGSRKKDPLRGRTNYIYFYDDIEGFYYDPLDPVDKIDLVRRIECWDDRWRRIMFRVFINEDKIIDVANDENITPWGLTKSIRKELNRIRNMV